MKHNLNKHIQKGQEMSKHNIRKLKNRMIRLQNRVNHCMKIPVDLDKLNKVYGELLEAKSNYYKVVL